MPPQVQSGKTEGLAELFKTNAKWIGAALKKAAPAPFVAGQMRIPGGITNGIAQFSEIKFGKVADGKQNAGQWFCRMVGICQEPKTVVVDGMTQPAQGCQTSIMEMLCDTTNQKNERTSREEHVWNLANHLKGLGFVFQDESAVTHEELQRAVKELTEAKPYFRFSTRVSGGGGINPKTKKPYEPRVWEEWLGIQDLADWQPQEDGDAGLDADQTGGDAAATGDLTDGTDQSDANADGALDDSGTTAADAGENVEHDAPVEDVPEVDFDDLLKKANAKNDTPAKRAAQTKLTALAVEAGADPESVESDFETWEAMVEYVQAQAGGDAPAEEAPEEPWKPKKGDTGYQWFPLTYDVKTKKMVKAKKPTSVEVLSVDEKAETVTIKDLVTGKAVVNATTKKPLGIKWADLIRE